MIDWFYQQFRRLLIRNKLDTEISRLGLPTTLGGLVVIHSDLYDGGPWFETIIFLTNSIQSFHENFCWYNSNVYSGAESKQHPRQLFDLSSLTHYYSSTSTHTRTRTHSHTLNHSNQEESRRSWPEFLFPPLLVFHSLTNAAIFPLTVLKPQSSNIFIHTTLNLPASLPKTLRHSHRTPILLRVIC